MCSDMVSSSEVSSINDLKVLKYGIYSCSSFLPSFSPENILEDNNADQGSRWSSETNNPPQFIMLKLEKMAIVKSITFGKYEKTHVCNLKKFKIYGGITDNTQIELLDSGLNNDSMPETFVLRHTLGDYPFPCRYIKIVPLQSWGATFNFSIWFVELKGLDDFNEIEKAIDWFHSYREREVVRLCMKHFRLLNYQNVFNELKNITQVKLEDPLLSELFDTLVLKGDFDASELFIENAITDGYLNSYITKQEYHPSWKMVKNDETRPGMRGGHQMVIDSLSETIFLFGGWDGHQDLSDLWSYHIPSNKWKLLSSDVEAEGGPSPRSCHKMVCNPQRREIFVLGRYLNGLYRTAYNLKSDFYVYNIESNRWTLISENTSLVGGPSLIFDHQMCMDVAKSTIYVFGGRILTPTTCCSSAEERSPNDLGPPPQEPQFSGLYSYHILTNTWKCLSERNENQDVNSNMLLKPRIGHCMLFHPQYRKLYIFNGQHNKEHLTDFLSYNVDTEHVEMISDFIKQDVSELPPLGYAQRASIDSDLDEIYVLSGLSKDKERREEDRAQNSFWVYSLKKYKWTCVYKNENVGEQYWSRMQYIEPCPRYAHQMVYDEKKKMHFLFGGNPGRMCLPKVRLDDFWSLQLCRTSHQEMLQRCKLLIRKCRFQELIQTDKLQALEFLQSGFSHLIGSNLEQEEQIQSMASLLFSEKQSKSGKQSLEDDKHKHVNRCELFEKLSSFFPESMTQPKKDLVDMIPL
ncbi:muskelin-like [Planococcus citri]|uniref:muskelin-like n=1 Tax=Planococcus citri TaxID=170843 RepID=UPI0031F75E34